MNGTTTRARGGRGASAARAAEARTASRRPYGSFVDGANALQIDYAVDYAEPLEYPEPQAYGEPYRIEVERPRRTAVPVAPPTPVSLPRPAFLVLIVAIVVGGVLGVLLLNTKINENAFRLDDLRARQAALDLQEQQLAQALAEKESPGNLAAQARQLGLVPAGTPAFIRLPDGRVVGVPRPAGALDGSGSAGR
jgi:hypothetical protein